MNADDIKLDDPSAALLGEYFHRLDGETMLGMAIKNDSGYLFLECSRENRIHIHFSNGTDEYGHLLDPNHPKGEGEIIFQLSNGQIDYYPEYMNFSKEMAVDIASHFFGKGTFPPGLHWEGQVGS